ncbi:MAG: UDP-N-acetylmuramoyl-tripeptide--D-alanyl-D-alanine ligase [Lachnospiraceae bacterium]|nr:UDP-N-acetylmuramoyl-tripeptide--D-alanyl-D-alanine ligase [Lachnospiraceae bacterium]
MIPVKVEQLVAAVGGKLLTGSGNRLIKDVIIDSREKAEDSLFVPIIGEKTDGHKYVAGALASGAKTLFMQKESAYKEEILSLAKDAGACVVAVEDTVSALQDFAAWYRNQFDIPVVGITGSVGKTTTKEMISAALETEKKVLKTIGNKNSQIGLPLMMFYLDDSYDVAVIEMGMSEVGEMKNLAAVARPECAVMTNIGVAHIAQLGSKENIRKEKLNIINEFDKKSVLFVNGNDTLLNNIATEITQKSITMDCDEASRAVLKDTKALTYGISTAEEFYISAVDLVTGGSGIGFTAVINAEGTIQKVPVQLKVYGNHNVMNALAALAVAMHYGISPEKAAEGLAEYEPIAMRGQIKTVNGITWIDDTYNASPDSMKSGAQVMLSLEGKRHIAVFADVLELGEASEQLHREVGAFLATLTEQGRTTDILVTVGAQAAFIADEAKKQGIKQTVSFASNAEATEFLKQTLTAGDVVLVKGSRGMHTEEIVKAFI